MTGEPEHKTTSRQQFNSGRDLINAVKTRREQAQAFKTLARDVEAELGATLESYDPELIDGVRILWIQPGTSARDETAFRHALKTAYRLRAAGERMTDNAIIDAYEHGYTVAQRHGADSRDSEMPSHRDRETMARRVRGYVIQSKRDGTTSTVLGNITNTERKALATMGRRGGQKAAQRWQTDPEGKYAQKQLLTLEAANKRRSARGRSPSHKIAAYFDDAFAQTGEYPTVSEAMAEFSVSKRTVQRALAKASIQLPTGRKRVTGRKQYTVPLR